MRDWAGRARHGSVCFEETSFFFFFSLWRKSLISTSAEDKTCSILCLYMEVTRLNMEVPTT